MKRCWLLIPMLFVLAACEHWDLPWQLQQSVYVWHRSPSNELVEAVRGHQKKFHSLYALALRVDLHGEKTEIAPAAALQVCLAVAPDREIIPMIQIEAHEAGLGNVARRVNEIEEQIPQLEALFEKAGAELKAIEFDYLCPEWLLPEYAAFIKGLDARFPPISFSFTAQPEWIGKPGWEELTDAADSYTLELHGIDLPPPASEELKMFDGAAAKMAVARADEEQQWFRVALPVYSSLVAETESGEVIAVSRTADFSPPPETSELIRVDPPVEEVVEFVRFLENQPPAYLKGVIWFRLPHQGDDLTWNADGLTSVMKGQSPERGIRFRFDKSGAGVSQIHMINAGDVSEPLPRRIYITGALSKILSIDAQPPYTLTTGTGLTLELDPGAVHERIAPGAEYHIGWARMSGGKLQLKAQ